VSHALEHRASATGGWVGLISPGPLGTSPRGRSLLASALLAVAGITLAILVPARTIPCAARRRLGIACFHMTQLYLPLRFTAGIILAIPLAMVLARRDVRRWMAIVAIVLVSSAIALETVQSVHDCYDSLWSCLYTHDRPARLLLVLAAGFVAITLLAISRIRGYSALVAAVFAATGLAAAAFIPVTHHEHYLGSQTWSIGPTDYHTAFRIKVAVAAVLVAILCVAIGVVRGWITPARRSRLPANPV